jgi:hypothetical protein
MAAGAEGVVVAAAVDHGRLSAFEAAGEQRREEQESDEKFCGLASHILSIIQFHQAGQKREARLRAR